MPDCKHCASTFTDAEEEAYLNHLVDEHADSLTRIDQRRIDQHPNVNPDELTYQVAKQTVILMVAFLLLTGVLFRFDLLPSIL